ncbi:coagulation factor V [Scyliorhinus torazame]|uniref:coagulation factor V n=1 Tax=Scyliorhinus torazame TaxID=75743 RepID=UPI003B59B958
MKRCCTLLLLISSVIDGGLSAVRLYYLAAVETEWVYSRHGGESCSATTDSYSKIVYKEYHDSNFAIEKDGPAWRGLLGPTLRAEVGDTLKIHFKNKAAHPVNICPQGIMKGQSADGFFHENILHFQDRKEPILPSQEHTYTWTITEEMGPTIFDSQCLTYMYSSHIDVVKDFHTGLIGTLLICKPGSLKENGKQKYFAEEFVLLFSVFDESESWNYENKRKTPIKMYSINGFTNGTLPELGACVHDDISWHLIGMSLSPEIFSVHFNGQVLLQNSHRVSSIALTPGSSVTAQMSPTQVGKWLLSSQVQHHRLAGLYGYLNIEKCNSEEMPPRYKPSTQRGKVRQYFIAAEEIMWDYAPDIQTYIDSDYKAKYLESGPNRIGKKYKKAIYVEYTDKTFTVLKKPAEGEPVSILENTIGVPVIRTEVSDIIKIHFKNFASQPYSIYPHGITVDKQNEGTNYPGNSTDTTNQVNPNETYIYTWKIYEDVGPTIMDPRCLTKLYHSAVDTTRDIATGLFGPLLICKRQSLNFRNLQIRVDEEQHVIFAAFDENQSWYIDENIQSCQNASSVDPADPEFYESNIMYTINGVVYDSQEPLPLCEGIVTHWHISSIGAQDHVQAAYFHGHTFKHRKTNEDVIHLFPLIGETLAMQMDSLGEWLLGILSSCQVTYGMRIRIKVYLCGEEAISYPIHYFRIQSKSDKVLIEVPEETSEEVIDAETLEFLKQFGLRSFQKPQVEQAEDITQFIEGNSDDSRELNTNTSTEQGSQLHSNVSGTQDEVPIDANKVTSLPNKTMSDDLEYDSAEDELGQPEKLSEGVLEAPLEEIVSDITHQTLSDSHMLNFTSIDVHLKKNTPDMKEEDIYMEISGDNYETRHDNSVLQNAVLSSATTITNFPFNANDMNATVNFTVKNKRSLAEIPVSALKQSQITAENISCVNITDGKREEESDLAPQQKSAETNSEGDKAEAFIGEGDKVVGTHTGNEMCDGQQTHQDKGTAVKIETSVELGLIGESLLHAHNQTIEPQNSNFTQQANAIQHCLGEDCVLDEMTSPNIFNEIITAPNGTGNKPKYPADLSKPGEAATSQANNLSVSYEHYQSNSSENNNSKNKVTADNEQSGEIVENFINASEGPRMESGEDTEKVFIYLKKHLTGDHRVRFQGVPLNPGGRHLTYQVEGRGISVSTLKHLRRYVKLTTYNNSTKQFKTVEYARRQAAVEIMMKRRKLSQEQMSPRGFKSGVKYRIPIPLGNQHRPPREFQPKPKHAVIYQDDSSNGIIIGIPKRNNGVTLDYDEYVANANGDLDEDGKKLDEEETNFDSMNPYTHDRRTHSDLSRDPEMIVEHYLRSHKGNVRYYFIAAEEVFWDYSRNAIDIQSSAEQRNTLYKKVIFRRYTNALFTTPYESGERFDHLGILGPVIRAEVNDVIKVMFKNLASRPYSIHAHGVSYEKSSEGEGYEDFSSDWFRSDNAVLPKHTYTYVWNVPPRSAPRTTNSVCKTWVYYSSVDYVKDINSGLIGPLVICQNGTLNNINEIPGDAREFVLLFHTFDETKSWYLHDNKEQLCKESCEMGKNDSNLVRRNTFYAINGFVNASLRGLVMFEKELVRWYLINMGSSEDVHSIRFHGQTFIERRESEHRLGIYNLYPGAFRTIEMRSSKPGIWLLDCENGEHYKAGMQAHLLVLSQDCDYPLGMASGSITDSQVTASSHEDNWEPMLARLHNRVRVNAWSAVKNRQDALWIQVDLERPMVLTKIATQGAKVIFVHNYITAFYIEYSGDGKNWTFYNGNSRSNKQIFAGNSDATGIIFNRFNPPIITRYLKLYPVSFKVRPTLRMELYGCEIDFCSQPLGMENGTITDDQITASSFVSSWWGSWKPSLARLDREGRINAWKSKKQNTDQWLQVNFLKKKKITGIITQGARSLTTTMFVQSYAVHYSFDGNIWLPYTDQPGVDEKIFMGNTDYYRHKKSHINPPISAKYIRIIPKSWYNYIALRLEIMGCDFE